MLNAIIGEKSDQGHVTEGLVEQLACVSESYDAMVLFAQKLANLPLRPDWPFVEPSDWAGIEAQMDPSRPRGRFRSISADDAAKRVYTAFLSSVCGCMLGKPLEINPTLDEIRTASEAIGEWPIRDYISEKINMQGRRHFHPDAPMTLRETLRYAAPDDDINYTIMGMLLLEDHGLDFTHDQMRRKWLENIPVHQAWGPERGMILKSGIASLSNGNPPGSQWYDDAASVMNPGEELCGAMIRADAYGYACPGNPELAAKLAWKDASFTHRRTGIYGTMFAAAAMAAAPVCTERLDVFRIAQQFVPQKSRFYKIVSDSLEEVTRATDWLDGYNRIHGKYKQYAHCRIYQEAGTLINSLRFAENIGDGFCKQVSQGNDTDSFGATAGSILGLYFGPDALEHRWLAPLNNTIHCSLACFYEQNLHNVALRMSRLPELTLAGSPSANGEKA